MNVQTDDNCIEVNEGKRLTDEEVKGIIQKYISGKITTELQNIEKITRDEIIRKIKAVDGVSTRQIARLTGISQSVISKA